MSTFDMAEVGTIKLEEVANYTPSEGLPKFTLSVQSPDVDKGYYGVRVVIGKMLGAGNNYAAHEYIRLIGTKGASEKVYLTGSFEYIAAGTYLDLTIETKGSLGEIQVLTLGIEQRIDDALFVDYSEVKDLSCQADDKETRFPCYHWISGNQSVTTTSKSATPKDVENSEILQKERVEQLKWRKEQYKWQYFPESGLPSGIQDDVEDIPDDEEFGTVKSIDFTAEGLHGVLASGLAGAFTTVDDLGDYANLVKKLDHAPLAIQKAGRWTSDVEFGRQILNGVNPVVVEMCTCLPANFPVTDDLVAPFMTRGKTMTEEMKGGNVFICDMKIMDGLTPREGHYAPAPICLLYVNSSQQLVPIAIQIKQGLKEGETPETNPIFVPSDNWIDWMLAKIFYQAAQAQFHQLSTHYQSCHAAMEAYGMATMRNLPDAHPINKLLRPHFRYTMAINTRARSTLINDGGIIDQLFGIGGAGKAELLKRASKIYSVDWTNIEKSVKRRKVENIPGYYYRDDGLKIFNALKEYVANVVNTFYASDKDVEYDDELQAWVEDIHTNAFPGYFGAPDGHGFPQKIVTKAELIEQCSAIIFNGSAQHASVNFGQYQIYGFIPNAPFALEQPPSEKKGVADYQQLLETLPNEDTARKAINITYALSQYSRDEVILGDFPFKRFLESEIETYISRLQERLRDISSEIEERNKGLDVPYTYMMPTKIPNSITI